ncbi:hypothetical protein RR46_02499 [Papilio xuthus]|uniref:Uncharacterized protein n=1 Tax=Papilio xuthus TaxID=66420 RepID=A0A194QH15_PAPXU|nr:hypothetical protein RR46_02499 [Papilio xuthus]
MVLRFLATRAHSVEACRRLAGSGSYHGPLISSAAVIADKPYDCRIDLAVYQPNIQWSEDVCRIKCTKSWRIAVRPWIAMNVSIHIRNKSEQTKTVNLSTKTLPQHLTGNTTLKLYSFVAVFDLATISTLIECPPRHYLTPDLILRIVISKYTSAKCNYNNYFNINRLCVMFTLSERLFAVDNVDGRTRMQAGCGCGVLEARRKRDMVSGNTTTSCDIDSCSTSFGPGRDHKRVGGSILISDCALNALLKCINKLQEMQL